MAAYMVISAVEDARAESAELERVRQGTVPALLYPNSTLPLLYFTPAFLYLCFTLPPSSPPT